MKKIKFTVKILIALIIVGSIFQAGLSVLAASTSGTLSTSATTDQTTTSTTTYTLDHITISSDVINQIKASDPTNYEQDISNYKHLLVDLNVSPTFKTEIENRIVAGHPLPDILIGYTFLYHQFGTMDDLDSFLVKRDAGTDWKAIFTAFDNNQAVFTPRSFDTDYLQQLMSMPSITSDDIMIADHVSFITKTSFDKIINAREQGKSWRDINAEQQILYSKNVLPRVQVTNEQINKYTTTDLTANQVIQAFVLANKIDKNPQAVVKQLQTGTSEEAIFAQTLQQKYD